MKKESSLIYIPEQKSGSFSLKPQHVSFSHDLSFLKKNLKEKEFEQFLSLYNKAQNSPKECLKQLEELSSLHPNVGQIYNLLTFVYLKLKKIRKAEKTIIRAFEMDPGNLFSKINYADYCLRKKKAHLVPKIFSGAKDLRDLYPSRQTFHISEFRGFITVMGFYHLSIKSKEEAICYHYLAHKVAPSHPSTLLLGKKIYHQNLFLKLLKIIKNKL